MSTSPFESSNILLTGGAGFLGRGFLRYLDRQRVTARVTVYSRDEAKHYALRARYPHVRTVLGDIRDTDRLAAVMAGHDTVIHMAAVKYIPEAERDVSEAIDINVNGSKSVAWAAMRAGVSRVVGISTDKACSPRNAYGATKMLMERTFQEAQRLTPHIRFTCVRYGNVVSSTGSVIPLFRDQLATVGYMSITSPEMTRFWISVGDAVRLIELAVNDDARQGRGHTYIARCAAMPIVDVAKAVAMMAGLRNDNPVRIIGVRPGEKLHEVLVDAYEAHYAHNLSDQYIIIPPANDMRGEGEPGVEEYSSESPAYDLTPTDMVSLIKDSMLV
jgi:UDP-N-acetylglucosamine 4,6-dehydratase